MSFDNYQLYVAEPNTINAGDSTLMFDFAYSPPEGTLFVNAGYQIDPENFPDETFFVPTLDCVKGTGNQYKLSLRRCGPIPKQNFSVIVRAMVAEIA